MTRAGWLGCLWVLSVSLVGCRGCVSDVGDPCNSALDCRRTQECRDGYCRDGSWTGEPGNSSAASSSESASAQSSNGPHPGSIWGASSGTVSSSAATSAVVTASSHGSSSQGPSSHGAVGCVTPWGAPLDSGSSVQAWQAPSPACGGACTAETRQCTNGTLTGSYLHASCQVQACADPVLIFSSTLGGVPRTTFTTAEIIHGRALNLLATNAQSCVEIVGTTDGFCGTLANWTTMPNADWSFEGASGEWRSALSAGAFPPGQYRSFWRNTQTGQSSAATVLTLTPPNPLVTYAASLGGASQDTFSRRATVHGRVVNLTASNAQSCVEIVGTNDGYCGTPGSWTTLPNNGWSFDAPSGQWRSAFWAGAFPAGQYRGYWRNSQTGQLSVATVLTLLETEPEVLYATSVGGPAQTTFSSGQLMYGRVLYLQAGNAQSCVEIVGTNDGYCGTPGSWTTMPNNDWSFDTASGEWRSVISAGAFPAGQYRGYWRNSVGGQVSVATVLNLVP